MLTATSLRLAPWALVALVTAACAQGETPAPAQKAAASTSKSGAPTSGAPTSGAPTSVAASAAAAPSSGADAATNPTQPNPTASLHGLKVTDIRGEALDLASLKGKAVLVVNTASQCGFTPQYAGLERLHRDYKDKGLVVLAFPSNDFGGQEPGDRAEIAGFVQEKFEITFPLMDKVEIRTATPSPVYGFLTGAGPVETRGPVKWNFTKFLVGKDGTIRSRYESPIDPQDPRLKAAIEAALSEPG